MTQLAAYDAAGYGSGKATEKSRRETACQIESRPDIKARLKELSDLANAGAILDARQIQTELSLMAIDKDRPDGVRLKAIDQLSKTKGLYTDNIKMETSGQLSIDDKRSYMRSLLDTGTP